jgi:hypothetical protein
METAELLKMVQALVDGINSDATARYRIQLIFHAPQTIRTLEKAAVLAVEAKHTE